jgi:hypothetical protein
MKKIFLFFIFGCISLYGFAVNPIDPSSKTGDDIKITSPSAKNECSELLTLVDVVITVTFTDCPGYSCSYPANCTFDICIYDANYNLVECQSFSRLTCSYVFRERMQDDQDFYAHLVRTSGSCTGYNQGYTKGHIPVGGGNVSINTTFCP